MDRKMLKWAPFDSVVSGKKVINEVMHEKKKIKKPILSEDQLKNIENKILDSYNSKDFVTISYYESGYIYNIDSYIKKIDYINKIVYLNNKLIFFNQIMNVI